MIIAAMALVLPENNKSAMELNPAEMANRMKDPNRFLSVDEAARSMIMEDSSIQLIDIRTQNDFLAAHIPGAINIPLSDLLSPDFTGYHNQPGVTAVYYSNGNTMASEAWMLCTQMGYPESKIMKGGLNEWFRIVMESEFSGEKISAADNALFEVRYRARDFFRQMNSLPDSLKTAFLEVKRQKEAELVGGCE